MVQHGRVYKDAAEKDRRFQIFKSNYEYIESINTYGNRTYKLGLNQFSDLRDDEFPSNPILSKSTSGSLSYANLNVHESMDWTAKGTVITPVKDQSSCEIKDAAGLMTRAIDNKVITTKDNYPYGTAQNACNTARASSSAAAIISSYEEVPAANDKSVRVNL